MWNMKLRKSRRNPIFPTRENTRHLCTKLFAKTYGELKTYFIWHTNIELIVARKELKSGQPVNNFINGLFSSSLKYNMGSVCSKKNRDTIGAFINFDQDELESVFRTKELKGK